MVDRHPRKNVEMSTHVDRNRKNMRLSEDTYEELTRLKVALGVRSYDEVIRRLMESSEVDPLKVADRKIEQLEEELAELVPHAYGAVSQSLVLCRAALRLDRARCERLQMELLAVLREMRKGEA